jgi:putative transposase
MRLFGARGEVPRPKAEKVAAARALPQPSQAPVNLPEGTRVTRIRANGAIRLKKVAYMVDGSRRGQEVLVVIDGERIIVADLAGEILIEHIKATPGIKYIGNGRPRGRRPGTRPSPKS